MSCLLKLLDADMLPLLTATIQAALTIPVSSCSCERSFSAVRRVHTWLRSTMEHMRLNHLAVMTFEKEVLEKVNTEQLIDRFATMKVRRHSLVVPK